MRMNEEKKEKNKNGKTTNWLTKGINENELLHIKKLALISYQIEIKRTQLGMNQKQFAKVMGVTQGMVSKWESGAYNFSITTLIDICKKLNLELTFNITDSVHEMGTSFELIETNIEKVNSVIDMPYKELIKSKGRSILNVEEVIA